MGWRGPPLRRARLQSLAGLFRTRPGSCPSRPGRRNRRGPALGLGRALASSSGSSSQLSLCSSRRRGRSSRLGDRRRPRSLQAPSGPPRRRSQAIRQRRPPAMPPSGRKPLPPLALPTRQLPRSPAHPVPCPVAAPFPARSWLRAAISRRGRPALVQVPLARWASGSSSSSLLLPLFPSVSSASGPRRRRASSGQPWGSSRRCRSGRPRPWPGAATAAGWGWWRRCCRPRCRRRRGARCPAAAWYSPCRCAGVLCAGVRAAKVDHELAGQL